VKISRKRSSGEKNNLLQSGDKVEHSPSIIEGNPKGWEGRSLRQGIPQKKPKNRSPIKKRRPLREHPKCSLAHKGGRPEEGKRDYYYLFDESTGLARDKRKR